ncbi:MAG: hypothetical protein MI724_08775 [Spirochaetales bacterium]|nr:hypothetical protein [Spirochaetales bacterium]
MTHKTRKTKSAEIASVLSNAPFLAVVPFMLINHIGRGFVDALLFDAISIGFGTLLPVAITHFWSRKTGDKRWDIPEKKDRLIPLLWGGVGYLLGAYILAVTEAPLVSVALMFCYGVNTLVVMVISVWWKVSIHAMGVMGPTTALFFAFGPVGAAYGLMLPIVIWARYQLRKHTMGQLIVGATLGLLLTAVQMTFFLGWYPDSVPPVDIAWITYAFIGPAVVLTVAGFLNQRGVRDGMTRKLFHFVGFTSIAVFSAFARESISTLFLASGVMYVSIACVAGEGFYWYDGIRRTSDRPYDRLYVVLPMVSMVIAILVANILFTSEMVLVGVLCVAVGDAIAEPIGTLMGRHKYSVFALVGKKTTRSVEGTLAIVVVCSAIIYLTTERPLLSIVSGVIVAIVEAVSPRGTDNFTVFQAASVATAVILHSS